MLKLHIGQTHFESGEEEIPMKRIAFLSVVLFALFISTACTPATPTIRIGINAEITGEIPKVGEGTRFAAEMWLEQNGGVITVGGTDYPVELVIEDNEEKAESAAAVNTKLITQDEVLVIVGPQSSKQAVPAGAVANDLMTPMISPWSTNPATTLDRPWVFRTPFLDPFQGPVVANFVREEFGFSNAGVLYDIASDYPKGLAEFFQSGWEDAGGTVVAFESFTTGDTDFSAQLTTIIDAGAEFIFTPQYYNEVALIVQQARELGFEGPIVGSDSWGSAELMALCGEACEGLFFSTHYAAEGATGATKEFIDDYNAKYGYVPDDVGALTWDAMNIVKQAIQDCGEITGDIAVDRTCVRDAMAGIEEFPGITGNMTFNEQGDPTKCAVIVRINEEGLFTFYKQVCP
jgi:branched-chain amino acid transport system substrate-binding protein